MKRDFRFTFQTGRPITLRSPGSSAGLSGTLTRVHNGRMTARLVSDSGRIPGMGDRMLAEYWDSKGLYFFFVKVIDVSGSEIVISSPDEGIEFQRRKSARVEAEIPMRGVIASAGREELIGEFLRDLKTEDIGQQGLRFQTNLPLEIGDTLLIWLDLSPKHSVQAHAWVVWTESGQKNERTSHSVGLSFLQLGPEDQMQLLQFIGRHQTSDRREFARWETSIPCKVAWDDHQIDGEIANLSVEGALVTSVRSLPPESGAVVLTIRAGEEDVAFPSKVTTQVIHTAWKTADDQEQELGLFGVEFMESGEELRHKLTPVLRSLFSKGRLRRSSAG